MDPFSITVGALGITDFAISRIVELHNFINGLAEAKEVVQDIASNLEGIQHPLGALKELSISDNTTYTAAKEDLKKTGVAEAVNKCGDACAKFSKDLERWTRHSSGSKLSLRDRMSVGVWNKEKIRTFRTQVQSCQAVVQFAVTSTQLLVQFRSEQVSKTDREELKKQLQDLQLSIQKHLDLTKKEQDEAQKRKLELQEEPEDEEDGGAQRTLAIKEVEEQSHLLEADQVSCGVMVSQLPRQRSNLEIGNVITADNSRALVGLPESVIEKINARIRDVTTQRDSAAAVGVFDKDVDMRDFFKRSS